MNLNSLIVAALFIVSLFAPLAVVPEVEASHEEDHTGDGFISSVRIEGGENCGIGGGHHCRPYFLLPSEGDFVLHVLATRVNDETTVSGEDEQWGRGTSGNPNDLGKVDVLFVPGRGVDGSVKWDPEEEILLRVEVPIDEDSLFNKTTLSVDELPETKYGWRVIVEETDEQGRQSEFSIMKDPLVYNPYPGISELPEDRFWIPPNQEIQIFNTLDDWEAIYTEYCPFTPMFTPAQLEQVPEWLGEEVPLSFSGCFPDGLPEGADLPELDEIEETLADLLGDIDENDEVTIEDETEADALKTGGQVTFVARVEDESDEVDRVEAEYRFELADEGWTQWEEKPMGRVENDRFESESVDIPDRAKRLEHRFKAYDEENDDPISETSVQSNDVQDTIPPEINEVLFNPSNPNHKESVELEVSATDNIEVTGVDLEVDGEAWEQTQFEQDEDAWSIEISLPWRTATYDIKITATDGTGNTATETRTLQVDPYSIRDETSAPGTGEELVFEAVVSDGAGAVVETMDVAYEFTRADGGTQDNGLETMSWDDERDVFRSGPVQVPVDAWSVEYTITAYDEEELEASESTVTTKGVKDVIDPVIVDVWIVPFSLIEGEAFDVVVEATDNIAVAGADVQFGDGLQGMGWDGNDDVWRHTVTGGLDGGVHSFQVTVRDGAGNTHTEERTITVHVPDPPELVDETDTGVLETGGVVAFQVDVRPGDGAIQDVEAVYGFVLADGSEVEGAVPLDLEDGSWVAGPLPVPGNAVGLTYTITVVDEYGKSDAVSRQGLPIPDTIAPKIETVWTGEGPPMRHEPFTVHVEATDNIGVVDVTVTIDGAERFLDRGEGDEGKMMDEWSVHVGEGLSAGEHSLVVTVRDGAGNTVMEEFVVVVQAPEPPEVTDRTDSGDLETGGSVRFRADVIPGEGTIMDVEAVYVFGFADGVDHTGRALLTPDGDAFESSPIQVPDEAVSLTYTITAVDDNDLAVDTPQVTVPVADTVPPVVEAVRTVPGDPREEHGFVVHVEATDNIGVESVIVTLLESGEGESSDDEEIAAVLEDGVWNAAIGARPPGGYVLAVTAVDAASNTAVFHHEIVVRELVPPTLSDETDTAGIHTGGPLAFNVSVVQGDADVVRVDVEYTFVLVDGNATHMLRLEADPDEPGRFAAPVVTVPEEAIALEYEIIARDGDDRKTILSEQVTIADMLAPVIEAVRTVPSSPMPGDDFQVVVEATDNIGIDNVQAIVDGGDTLLELEYHEGRDRWESTVAAGALDQGAYVWTATARDAAGNEVGSEPYTMVVGDPIQVTGDFAAQLAQSLQIRVFPSGDDTVDVALEWDPIPFVSGYQVWRSSSPYLLADELSPGVTQWSDAGAPNGTRYIVTPYLRVGGFNYGHAEQDPEKTIPGFENLKPARTTEEDDDADAGDDTTIMLANNNDEPIPYVVRLILKDENGDPIGTEYWNVTVEPGETKVIDLNEHGALDGAAGYEVVYTRADTVADAQPAGVDAEAAGRGGLLAVVLWGLVVLLIVMLVGAVTLLVRRRKRNHSSRGLDNHDHLPAFFDEKPRSTP